MYIVLIVSIFVFVMAGFQCISAASSSVLPMPLSPLSSSSSSRRRVRLRKTAVRLSQRATGELLASLSDSFFDVRRVPICLDDQIPPPISPSLVLPAVCLPCAGQGFGVYLEPALEHIVASRGAGVCAELPVATFFEDGGCTFEPEVLDCFLE